MVQFRENPSTVPVYFQDEELGLYTVDGEFITFTLQIGLIPTQYATTEFFN